jgi:hypothetical protein
VSEFRVLIRTDNAAFEEGGRDAETVRLLRYVADCLEGGVSTANLRDINGNPVGDFGFRTDEVMP